MHTIASAMHPIINVFFKVFIFLPPSSTFGLCGLSISVRSSLGIASKSMPTKKTDNIKLLNHWRRRIFCQIRHF